MQLYSPGLKKQVGWYGVLSETFGMAWDGWSGTSIKALLAYRLV